MSLHLLHLANINSTNIGNGALIQGTEKIVEEDISSSINWGRLAWDDYTFGLKQFDRLFVDKINNSDGLLVGGAVTFNGREYLSNAGMRFDLPLDYLKEINKPIIFYGLSYRHWKDQEYHHVDKLKESLAYIIASEKIIFGVRNDGTKKWLNETVGLASDKIIEVPDPGMFVPVNKENKFPEFLDKHLNIIVSFNDEDSGSRFSKPIVRSKIIGAVARTIEELDRRYKINVIIIPHYFDDYKMISDFINETKPQLAHQRMVTTGLSRINQTAEFYGRYCCADLILCMRVHAMSPSIGHALPVLPIITQKRMWDYLHDTELSDIALDAFDHKLEAKLLDNSMSIIEDNSQVISRCMRATNNMRERISKFNSKIEELLNG